MMAVLFDTTMSADETMDAIEELRNVTGESCFISGMSAVVTDTKNLSNKETPIYVLIAVILSAVVLSLTITIPKSSPNVKLIKHKAINPAIVVMELPTTDENVDVMIS